MNRRKFLRTSAIVGGVLPFISSTYSQNLTSNQKEKLPYSNFYRTLEPIGRAMEMKGYYVWCNSPIYGPDGKVHLFFSRWKSDYGMSGWIRACEIAHAVANSPEDKFEYLSTVLSPREGYFDSTTCHNPTIHQWNGRYYLLYMGNSNGRTNTKRIGLAVADSLNGPWERHDKPLVEVGKEGAWDDHCTTNPALVFHPNGEFWLYYKSWNSIEYENAPKGTIRGNRKYGLAIAKSIEGPYEKYNSNPVIDFSSLGNNKQLEDAYVWMEDGKFKLIARDMGFFDHKKGLLFESNDGIHWYEPQIAYGGVPDYEEEPPAPSHLKRYGRLERPQLLMKNGKPDYLFTTSQGGKYMTSSSFVFKIKH